MFAQYFPTIAVDGCEKRCAKKAIEKYSGKTARSIVVSSLLKKWGIKNPSPRRELNKEGLELASKAADEIATAIDTIFSGGR